MEPSDAADDGELAGGQRRLVHVELVGVDRALHHRLAQAVAGGDEDDVGEAALGVEREHHAGGAQVGAHHALHAGGQRDLGVGVALVHAVADRAVVVERREDFAHLVQHAVDADDVQEGLLLAGERRVGHVLGGGRRAHRERGVRVAGGQAREFLAHARFELGRERRVLDPAADLGAGLGQRAHVVGVERLQARGDALGEAAELQELAERVRRRGEAAGDANARGGQLADHLAEAGVLAADDVDVGHPQLFERDD